MQLSEVFTLLGVLCVAGVVVAAIVSRKRAPRPKGGELPHNPAAGAGGAIGVFDPVADTDASLMRDPHQTELIVDRTQERGRSE